MDHLTKKLIDKLSEKGMNNLTKKFINNIKGVYDKKLTHFIANKITALFDGGDFYLNNLKYVEQNRYLYNVRFRYMLETYSVEDFPSAFIKDAIREFNRVLSSLGGDKIFTEWVEIANDDKPYTLTQEERDFLMKEMPIDELDTNRSARVTALVDNVFKEVTERLKANNPDIINVERVYTVAHVNHLPALPFVFRLTIDSKVPK